jgi:hypothetical protein
MEDPDRDGLTNLQEFQKGTDPTNPDTDGDGLIDGDEVNKYRTNPLLPDTDGDLIPDGVEVQTGTNPLDRNSYDLKKATATSIVTPPSFTLTTSIANPVLSVQLNWKVKLIDGKTTLDLTADPRTQYSSSDLSICSFGQQPGLIFAGNTGTCTITITQNTLSVPVPGTVASFTPTEVSTLNVPGAVAVDVGGSFAYVAAGTNGLVVVDVNDRTKPAVRGMLKGLGDAEGIRTAGQYVCIADVTGFLRVVNVQNPDGPILVSSLPIAGKPLALAVHGTMVAIAAQAGGVAVVNISDPANPTLIGTFPVAAPALGVDFDPQSGLAAAAMGTGGLQLADISNPATPKLRGSFPGGDVRRVLLRLPAALLADVQRSITAVDVSNPDVPVLSSSLPSNLGGVPVDIAAFGNIAMTADITFGRAVPIINISNPLTPVSVTFWTLQSPGFSSSIAVDLAFGYLIVPATSTLRILKYQNIVNTFGIPPTVSITSPTSGMTLIEGQTITFSANATDDVAVASVNFLVDGQTVFTTSAAPYQFQYTVPVTATMLTFGATAVDFGNNVGVAQNVQVAVIPDPGTTVTGRVVDANGAPVGGATVNVPAFQSSPTSATAADGSFSLSGVSTISGNIQVLAKFVNSSGATLAGFSKAVAPVRGGTVDAGTITLLPIPVITKMSVKSMLEGSQISLQVAGTTLTGAAWAFEPAAAPPIAVEVISTSQDGTSATLSVTAPGGVVGTFALVASNAAGDSGSAVNRVNRLTIVDPNSTADTDGDGFQDVIEAVFGTDPLDPTSFPVIPSFTETESVAFSVLNAPVTSAGIQETEGVAFSVLNGPVNGAGIQETESVAFSILNAPVGGAGILEAESVGFSVLNAPISSSGIQEIESVPFSILNGPVGTAGITEADAYFTVCNGPNCPPTSSSAATNASKPATLQSNSTTGGTQAAIPFVVDPLADSDGDGLPDWFELLIGTDPQNADTDGDGLTDFDEVFIHHTDPLDADTDGDGFSDGEEILFGSDPLNSASTPLNARQQVIAKGNGSKNFSTIQGDTNEKARSKKLKSRTAPVGAVSGGFRLHGAERQRSSQSAVPAIQ